jgi:hypothetical protein
MRRDSSIQANSADAQPRSTYLQNRARQPSLTAASTGTPSEPEDTATNYKINNRFETPPQLLAYPTHATRPTPHPI